MPSPPSPRSPNESNAVHTFENNDALGTVVAERECLFCGASPPKSILVKACGVWEAPYMISDEADLQEAWVASGWACFSCLRQHGEWEEDPGA